MPQNERSYPYAALAAFYSAPRLRFPAVLSDWLVPTVANCPDRKRLMQIGRWEDLIAVKIPQAFELHKFTSVEVA